MSQQNLNQNKESITNPECFTRGHREAVRFGDAIDLHVTSNQFLNIALDKLSENTQDHFFCCILFCFQNVHGLICNNWRKPLVRVDFITVNNNLFPGLYQFSEASGGMLIETRRCLVSFSFVCQNYNKNWYPCQKIFQISLKFSSCYNIGMSL